DHVEAGLPGEAGEHLGLARGGIDLEHLGAAEVDHEELAGLGVEGEVEQVRARVLDRDLAQQPSVGTEDKRWPTAPGKPARATSNVLTYTLPLESTVMPSGWAAPAG